MALNEDEAPEQLELTAGTSNEAAQLEAKRESLVHAINSCQLNTIEERVAWLLNHFPKTRDSDIGLQIRYWQNFQSDHFDGGEISVSDYYRLAKLTTLTRARATIQNKLKLFQACDEVKKRRKQLQESEHNRALKKRANYHQYSIYVDESGKTQDNLVVGSLWFLNSSETVRLHAIVMEWKKAHNFDGEFHFQSITEAKLPNYMDFADLISKNSALISFKAVSVPRSGIPNIHDALLKLTCHLLVRGVEHEHTTGRAILPRGINVCKDAEEIGRDKIFTAELSDQIKQAASTLFHGDLYVENFSAEESANIMHLQIADLFTSSVNRQLNAKGERKQTKDRFADYFLQKIGHANALRPESIGDMTVHITL